MLGVVAAVLVIGAGGFALVDAYGVGNGAEDRDIDVTTSRPDNRELRCPKPSGGPGELGLRDSSGPGALVPKDAVTARFCPGLASGDAHVDERLTGTTITHDVQLLVRAVNTLPAAERNPICHLDLGPTYDLVFGYADGGSVRVSLESFGCGFARSGEEVRMGARDVPDLGSTLLRGQPGAPTELICPRPAKVGDPEPGSSGRFVPEGADAARLCPHDAAAGDGMLLDPRRTARLVERLNALPPVDPGVVCTEELGPTYDLLLHYPSDDQRVVTFQDYGCGFARSGDAYRMGAKGLTELMVQLDSAQR